MNRGDGHCHRPKRIVATTGRTVHPCCFATDHCAAPLCFCQETCRTRCLRVSSFAVRKRGLGCLHEHERVTGICTVGGRSHCRSPGATNALDRRSIISDTDVATQGRWARAFRRLKMMRDRSPLPAERVRGDGRKARRALEGAFHDSLWSAPCQDRERLTGVRRLLQRSVCSGRFALRALGTAPHNTT